MARGDSDEVLEALENVISALEQNAKIIAVAVKRSRQQARLRARGLGYRQIVAEEERPLVVEMLSANIGRLLESGASLRRAEAKALHDEGATMEEIANLFGVTRQRVSTLLRDGRRIAERDAASRRGGARKAGGRPAKAAAPSKRAGARSVATKARSTTKAAASPGRGGARRAVKSPARAASATKKAARAGTARTGKAAGRRR